jgi:histidinol-phosphatase (PHP family)
MYLMDYHHHTNNSFDSNALMEEVCKEAINNNIKEICFTEHFSLNPVVPTFGHMDFNKYFKEIQFCREKYQNQLIIKAGIEICEPHQFKDKYEEEFKEFHLDFILGSVHNINNNKLRKFLENKTIHSAYSEYFEEVYKMVCSANIDVIAHLDLLKRYSINTIGSYEFIEFKEQITTILKKAIERNIGIEINTSGFRHKVSESLPSINIVQLYKDLGGEILTIGSDSHNAETVGAHLIEAINMAKECGFTSIFKFDRRNPIAINI